MKKMLFAFAVMLSASCFAGCAVEPGDDGDEASQSDDAEAAGEDVGSAESELIPCPSLPSCKILEKKCQNPAPNEWPACDLLPTCYECYPEPE